jgi:hypothetical protein
MSKSIYIRKMIRRLSVKPFAAKEYVLRRFYVSEPGKEDVLVKSKKIKVGQPAITTIKRSDGTEKVIVHKSKREDRAHEGESSKDSGASDNISEAQLPALPSSEYDPKAPRHPRFRRNSIVQTHGGSTATPPTDNEALAPSSSGHEAPASGNEAPASGNEAPASGNEAPAIGNKTLAPGSASGENEHPIDYFYSDFETSGEVTKIMKLSKQLSGPNINQFLTFVE